MQRFVLEWLKPGELPPKSFVCGYCSKNTGTDKVYATGNVTIGAIYICAYCNRPTFFGPEPVPGPTTGETVAKLPTDVDALYREIRAAFSAGAFTLVVLGCRKILMHIAVEKGATAGDSFISYVEHLDSEGFIPPNGKGWVDYIRTKGNEANHKINLMTADDSRALIDFTSLLMKFTYEFPSRVPPPAVTP